MPVARMLGIVVVLLGTLFAYLSVFTVNERERAVVFQFKKIVRVVDEPGLHFMIPFLQNAITFERRLMILDSQPERILTGEKMNLIVDYFTMWRISDVEAFYVAFRGAGPASERRASIQLTDVITDGLQKELNSRTITQVVTDDRDVIMQNLTASANNKMGKLGIEVVDVRIKQIELEGEVQNSIFEQMRAERKRIAFELRAKGQKQANIIRAEAERKRIELLADARRRSEIIRGNGDATATEVYAKAYNQDPEFYSFYRSMQGYRNSFNSKDDVIVLEPDSEFFKYFGSSK